MSRRRFEESPNLPPTFQVASFISLEDIRLSQGWSKEEMWPACGIRCPRIQGAEPRVHLPPDSSSGRWLDTGIWMAQREQIEDREWWVDKGTNTRFFKGIGCIISCVGHDTKPFVYPKRTTNSMKTDPWSLPVNYKGGRGEKLEELTDSSLEVLNQGNSILMHCNYSFHRAPMGLLSACRYWFGVNAAPFMTMLSGMRQIDPQYELIVSNLTGILETGQELAATYAWASTIQPLTWPQTAASQALSQAARGEPALIVYRSWREDLAEIRFPARYDTEWLSMVRQSEGADLLGYALACVQAGCQESFGESAFLHVSHQIATSLRF